MVPRLWMAKLHRAPLVGLTCPAFFPLQVTTGGDGNEAGQNEVIEFPWVVLDVESKQIMDEQKLVVRSRPDETWM